MTRCVVISEIPVAYRAGWFRFVRESSSVDLRVVYLAAGQSDRPWEVRGGSESWITLQRTVTPGGTSRGYFPRLAVGLGRTLSRLGPEVVIIPGWAHPVCWQAVLWCRRHRVPYAVSFESWKAQDQTRLPRFLRSGARRLVLERSAMALPVGERAAGFAATLGLASVEIVHANTCDSAGVAAETSTIAKADTPTVLYVGRLMEHKGAGLLRELAPRLAARHVRVRIVGDGPERGALEALSAAEPMVEVLGPLEPSEVRREMAQAWVVLVPSLEEPWGVVVHEALASGTPVVATTEVGSAAELVHDEHVGAVVAPDVWALDEACTTVLSGLSSDTAGHCREAALRISYETATCELESAVSAALGRGMTT